MRSRFRMAAVLGLAAAMLTSLAMVGSAALGKSKPSASQSQYKVVICHRTKSKKKPFHTISVSSSAVPAHRRHGDTLGPCPTSSHSTSSSSTSSNAGDHGNRNGKGKGRDK